jgi:signal transduction histidine kinase
LEPKPVDTIDRTILNAIPIPAFVVDDDIQIVDMNSAAARLCARDHEVVYKCRGGEVLHCLHSTDITDGCGRAPLCQQCVIRHSVTSCLQGHTVSRARMSMDFLPESGEKTRELLITSSPISTSGERLALLIVEDITVNDAFEQALRQSEKLAVTGRLIATLAHEINNPLDSLTNALHVLGTNPTLDDSGREMVEVAKQEVERLANLSRETLAPHRETKLPVVTKVSELLDDVLAMFRRRLESLKIEVRREYQAEGVATIYPGKLRQVFTNLISNAIDAMGERGELSLSIETLPDCEVMVRVADTGCGIPSENLNTIFDWFFTTKGETGTGIGLWVTKSIVEQVGGRIEVVSSTTGTTGTCFSIFLPATTAGTREPADDVEVKRKPA